MALSLFRVYDKPVGLHLDIGKCLNGCIYCYSNKRTGKTTSLLYLEKILNSTKNESLKDYYIQNRYPISVSNNSDINSCSNSDILLEIIKQFKKAGFPILWETKGTHNLKQMDKFISVVDEKDIVYLTITTFDDEKRKEIEPAAPTVENRLELVKQLRQKGIKTEIGFNPCIPGFITDQEIINFIENNIDINYVFQTLHLPMWSKLKIKKLPEYDLYPIGKYFKERKIPVGSGSIFYSSPPISDDIRNHYGKPMIIATDLDNITKKFKMENLGEYDSEYDINNLVNFDEFIKENQSNLIPAIVDKSEIYPGRNAGSYFYTNLPEKMTYLDYIKLCFNHSYLGFIFAYSTCGRLEYKNNNTKYYDYR
jgi:DNA repair photolyase